MHGKFVPTEKEAVNQGLNTHARLLFLTSGKKKQLTTIHCVGLDRSLFDAHGCFIDSSRRFRSHESLWRDLPVCGIAPKSMLALVGLMRKPRR